MKRDTEVLDLIIIRSDDVVTKLLAMTWRCFLSDLAWGWFEVQTEGSSYLDTYPHAAHFTNHTA